MNLADFQKITQSETYLKTNLQSFKLKDKIIFSEQPYITAIVDDDTAFVIDFNIANYDIFTETVEPSVYLCGFLFPERAPKESLFEQEELTQGVSLNAVKYCQSNSGLLSCNIEDLLKQPRYIAQTAKDEQEFIAKVTHQDNNVTINLDAVIEDFLNLYYYNSEYIIP